MEALALPAPVDPLALDQRVQFYGATWKDYEILLALRGESAVPRITYLCGRMELMSPSLSHEYIKTTLARILEAWALQEGVEITGCGSWTLKSAQGQRGLEPDECYVLGGEEKERPDLAIEVIWTSGGIDKLEVYRGLGVGEVWFWREGGVEVYRLEGDSYVRIERSELLPHLDLVRVARHAILRPQTSAVRKFLGA